MIRLRDGRWVAPGSRQVGRLTGCIVAGLANDLREKGAPGRITDTGGGRRATGRVPISNLGRGLALIERGEAVSSGHRSEVAHHGGSELLVLPLDIVRHALGEPAVVPDDRKLSNGLVEDGIIIQRKVRLAAGILDQEESTLAIGIGDAPAMGGIAGRVPAHDRAEHGSALLREDVDGVGLAGLGSCSRQSDGNGGEPCEMHEGADEAHAQAPLNLVVRPELSGTKSAGTTGLGSPDPAAIMAGACLTGIDPRSFHP